MRQKGGREKERRSRREKQKMAIEGEKDRHSGFGVYGLYLHLFSFSFFLFVFPPSSVSLGPFSACVLEEVYRGRLLSGQCPIWFREWCLWY